MGRMNCWEDRMGWEDRMEREAGREYVCGGCRL